jgi:hypothetical protein
MSESQNHESMHNVDVDLLDTVVGQALSSGSAAERWRQRHEELEARRAALTEAAHAAGCEPCIHAMEHGWWGDIAPARTHCRDCHRSWRSRIEGHCTLCHSHFFNPKAFDAHLTAEGCRPPATVARRDGQPRLHPVSTPYGELWRLVNYRPLPDFSQLPR